MRRAHFEIDQILDVEPSVAWEAVTDWTAQSRWMVATTVTATSPAHKPASNQSRGVGDEIRARTGFGPFAVVDTMVVTQWRPPYRCEVLHTGRLIRGPGVIEVVPVDAQRSRLVWSEDLELPLGFAGVVGWSVMRPAVRWGFRRSLRRLRDLLDPIEGRADRTRGGTE